MFCRWKKGRNIIWSLFCNMPFFAMRRVIQIAILGAMILLVTGCISCKKSSSEPTAEQINAAAKKINNDQGQKYSTKNISKEILKQLNDQKKIIDDLEKQFERIDFQDRVGIVAKRLEIDNEKDKYKRMLFNINNAIENAQADKAAAAKEASDKKAAEEKAKAEKIAADKKAAAEKAKAEKIAAEKKAAAEKAAAEKIAAEKKAAAEKAEAEKIAAEKKAAAEKAAKKKPTGKGKAPKSKGEDSTKIAKPTEDLQKKEGAKPVTETPKEAGATVEEIKAEAKSLGISEEAAKLNITYRNRVKKVSFDNYVAKMLNYWEITPPLSHRL